MPCPHCGSHYLWDDNLAWGCRECRWMWTVESGMSDRPRTNGRGAAKTEAYTNVRLSGLTSSRSAIRAEGAGRRFAKQ